MDNGGEFNSTEFREFCESLNVKLKTTAAESLWGNGLIEKHNGIIRESVEKVMEDISCSLDVALAWAISAKNALQNVYVFFRISMFLGKIPTFEMQCLPSLLLFRVLHKVN